MVEECRAGSHHGSFPIEPQRVTILARCRRKHASHRIERRNLRRCATHIHRQHNLSRFTAKCPFGVIYPVNRYRRERRLGLISLAVLEVLNLILKLLAHIGGKRLRGGRARDRVLDVSHDSRVSLGLRVGLGRIGLILKRGIHLGLRVGRRLVGFACAKIFYPPAQI